MRARQVPPPGPRGWPRPQRLAERRGRLRPSLSGHRVSGRAHACDKRCSIEVQRSGIPRFMALSAFCLLIERMPSPLPHTLVLMTPNGGASAIAPTVISLALHADCERKAVRSNVRPDIKSQSDCVGRARAWRVKKSCTCSPSGHFWCSCSPCFLFAQAGSCPCQRPDLDLICCAEVLARARPWMVRACVHGL